MTRRPGSLQGFSIGGSARRQPMFVLVPGWVTSANDGDHHWINGSQLAHLYQLGPHEYIVLQEEVVGIANMPDHLIPLRPRNDGNYGRPTVMPPARIRPETYRMTSIEPVIEPLGEEDVDTIDENDPAYLAGRAAVDRDFAEGGPMSRMIDDVVGSMGSLQGARSEFVLQHPISQEMLIDTLYPPADENGFVWLDGETCISQAELTRAMNEYIAQSMHSNEGMWVLDEFKTIDWRPGPTDIRDESLRRVAKDQIGGVRISTVLSLETFGAFTRGWPAPSGDAGEDMFETLVDGCPRLIYAMLNDENDLKLGDGHDINWEHWEEHQIRHSSCYVEALEVHQDLVAAVRLHKRLYGLRLVKALQRRERQLTELEQHRSTLELALFEEG